MLVGPGSRGDSYVSVAQADLLPKMHWRLKDVHRYHGFHDEIEDWARMGISNCYTPGETLQHSVLARADTSDLWCRRDRPAGGQRHLWDALSNFGTHHLRCSKMRIGLTMENLNAIASDSRQ